MLHNVYAMMSEASRNCKNACLHFSVQSGPSCSNWQVLKCCVPMEFDLLDALLQRSGASAATVVGNALPEHVSTVASASAPSE